GPTASTLKVRVASGPTSPPADTARTVTACPPPASPVYDFGEGQGVNGAPSRLHSNMGPAPGAVKGTCTSAPGVEPSSGRRICAVGATSASGAPPCVPASGGTSEAWQRWSTDEQLCPIGHSPDGPHCFSPSAGL